MKKLILDLVSEGINENKLWELGENTSFYGMEWVGQGTYDKVIGIMDEARNKIRECIASEEASEEKNIPLMAIGVVDKFKLQEKED